MRILNILSVVFLVSGLNAQTGILLTSNWTGTETDINTMITILFQNYPCTPATPVYKLLFVTPGLSFLSPISSMSTENARYTSANTKYEIGEVNNFVNFIFPPPPSIGPPYLIQGMYPSDSQIISVMIATVNALYDPTQPKQGVMIIMKRTNDINNLNVGNYENYILQINQLGWSNVKFLDYQSAEKVIYQLRLNPYFNIISLLSDPSDNRDLIQKAFMANLMLWRYRWIIFNLLGEYNPMANQALFGMGVSSNNVSVLTFADYASDLTGRSVLLQDSLKLVRIQDCDASKGLTLDTTSGTLNVYSFSRQSFKYVIYTNPGSNASAPSYITSDAVLNTVVVPANVKFTPFTMNVQTSLTSTQSKVFRIGFVNYPPYSYKDGNNYTGFVMEVLIRMLTNMKVSYTVVDLSDQYTGLNVGSLNSTNLAYNQLLGLVQNNVVDTLSFLFIINSDMMSSFDFSSSLLPGYISVLYKNRTLTGFENLVMYTYPFRWEVWATILGCSIGVAFALTITDFVFPDKYARYRLFMSLFFSLSSLTHGAYFDPPRRIGGRMIMSFWWLYCLVIVIIWACNYAAFLAQLKYGTQLTTVFSLLNQKIYTYGTLNDTVFINFLRKNNQSDPQSMLQIMTEDSSNGLITDLSTAVSLVTNNNFAFIYTDRTVTYLRNLNCLDLFGNWMGFDYGLVLPKNSEKTLAINNAIMQLRASGYMNTMSNKSWPVYNDSCISNDIINQMTIKLQQIVPNFFTSALDMRLMIGVFVVVIAGSGCCLFLSLVERLIRKIIQIRKDKHDKYEYDNTVEQLTKF